MNTASRLLNITKTLSKSPPSHPSSYAWSSAFLDGKKPSQQDMMFLAGKIDLVNSQIENLEHELAFYDSHIPPEIYTRHIQRMKESLAPNRLGSTWKDVNTGFNNESVVFLEWYSYFSKNKEEAIPEEELNSLRAKTEEFYEELKSDPSRSALKHVLMQQIKSLLEALENYDISGVAPIESILEGARGQLTTKLHVFKEGLEKDANTSSKFVKGYAAIMDLTSKTAKKATTFAQSGNTLITFGSKLLELTQSAPPP